MDTSFNCILFNEVSKIPGLLYLKPDEILFMVSGFEQTNLNFTLKYNQIKTVEYYKVFDIEVQGLKIKDKNGNSNIILMSEFVYVYKTICSKL